MTTTEQKRIIQSIVSIFETGKAAGDPSAVAVLPDGAGISYGIHQATDGSDSLDAILLEYIQRGGAQAAAVRALLVHVQADESTRYRSLQGAPGWLAEGAALLRSLGADPVMRAAQEAVFDRLYWASAHRQAEEMGLTHPLSVAIVYDTCIHSGPGGVGANRARFAELPPARGGDELAWAAAYVKARRAWLASRGGIVAQTVYRMDAFLTLIAAGNWALTPPFKVRGVVVS